MSESPALDFYHRGFNEGFDCARKRYENLLPALKAILWYPSVREALAPRESLGSLLADAESAIAKAEGLKL